MAFEKRYTARQVAEAVLRTTQELLAKSELVKAEKMDKCGTFSKVHEKAKREGYSEVSADKIAGKAKAMEKYEPTASGKENAKPNEHHSKDADQHADGAAPKGEIHPKEHVEGKSDDVRHTPAPGNNPKEQAEGNNELAGTTPTQVGQDGKNVPGGDEIRGHLKLAKFIGRMEHKRSLTKKVSAV
jgi:hypothetical protein